jgi:hypothetical protein
MIVNIERDGVPFISAIEDAIDGQRRILSMQAGRAGKPSKLPTAVEIAEVLEESDAKGFLLAVNPGLAWRELVTPEGLGFRDAKLEDIVSPENRPNASYVTVVSHDKPSETAANAQEAFAYSRLIYSDDVYAPGSTWSVDGLRHTLEATPVFFRRGRITKVAPLLGQRVPGSKRDARPLYLTVPPIVRGRTA